MRTVTLSFVVLLFFTAIAAGQAPKIHKVIDSAQDLYYLEQNLDLWIKGPAGWSLELMMEDQGASLLKDGQLQPGGLLWEGAGAGQYTLVLELVVDLVKLGQGGHDLEVAVALQGAQGLMGLRIHEQYWLLALGCSELFVVGVDEQAYGVPNTGWFSLQQGERVVWQGEEIFVPVDRVELLGSEGEGQTKRFSWQPQALQLEAGDWAPLTLTLQGPAPSGELKVASSPYLELDTIWSLGGEPLELVNGSLVLPELFEGSYELRGGIRALLPPRAMTIQLEANWKNYQTQLSVWLGRSWHDFSLQQRIQVTGERQPVLLPGGQVTFGRAKDPFLVPVEGLDALVSLREPRDVFWVGTPLAETTEYRLESGHGELDFFTPIFVWDQELRWRLLSRSANWFFDLSPKGQRVTGQLGALGLSLEGSRLTLASTPKSWQAGAWQWWDRLDAYGGSFNGGAWSLSLALPKQGDKEPSWRLAYGEGPFKGSIGSKELALSYRNEGWALGFGLPARKIWVEVQKANVRFELSPQGAKLAYGKESGLRLTLHGVPGEKLSFELTQDAFEGYLQASMKGDLAWGLRLKVPKRHGPWHILTSAAYEQKGNIGLLELKQTIGYSPLAWCSVYLEAATQIGPRFLGISYGGGLVFTPFKQAIVSLTWQNDRGFQVKAGVAIPFVERINEGDY